MNFFCETDIGRIRKNNEDSYVSALLDGDVWCFAVADGVGGSAGGEVASRLATDTLMHHLSSVKNWDPTDTEAILQEAVLAANTMIYEKGASDPDLEGMATTLTACVLHHGQGWLIHVGDSRAYLIDQHMIQQITDDHTLGLEMVKEGRLTPEDASLHPYRHVLTRALGVKAEVQPVMYRVHPKKGQWLLLCTDGLTNMLRDEQIKTTVDRCQSPEDGVRSLIDEALQRGGHDNVTVILARAD